jgi:hypothetical protein
MVPYRDRTSGWPAKQMDGEPGGTEGSTLAWLYMMFDEDRPGGSLETRGNLMDPSFRRVPSW